MILFTFLPICKLYQYKLFLSSNIIVSYGCKDNTHNMELDEKFIQNRFISFLVCNLVKIPPQYRIFNCKFFNINEDFSRYLFLGEHGSMYLSKKGVLSMLIDNKLFTFFLITCLESVKCIDMPLALGLTLMYASSFPLLVSSGLQDLKGPQFPHPQNQISVLLIFSTVAISYFSNLTLIFLFYFLLFGFNLNFYFFKQLDVINLRVLQL